MQEPRKRVIDFTIKEINQLRIQKGLSMRKVADLAGVSSVCAWGAFTGRSKPQDVKWYRMAKTVLNYKKGQEHGNEKWT